jgi:hypothetical protein
MLNRTTNITKVPSVILEMQQEKIREHYKSDSLSPLLLQSYPSDLPAYAFVVMLLEVLSPITFPDACKVLTCFLFYQCVRKKALEVQCGVLPRQAKGQQMSLLHEIK